MYGPAMVERFTTISGSTLKIFYLMATWNPYATVMMESDFNILPASPCDPDGDGVASVSDVQLLINQAQGLAPLGDLNADGVVNVVDVQDDINWVLNLGCSATAGTMSGEARGYRSSTVARAVSPAWARIADFGTSPGRRFLWEAGTVAYGSNSSGEIVGLAWLDGRSAYHAFLLNGAMVTDLGTLGGTESAALAINNGGLIVGWADTSSGQPHAFLWSSGRMLDLNDIVPREEDVVLEVATSIDDAGQISASGSDGRIFRITLQSPFR
jgi:probable HAF family extracellular repeat protein